MVIGKSFSGRLRLCSIVDRTVFSWGSHSEGYEDQRSTFVYT
jgi:hypothetical protein